jgi:uncharacterized protein (UPF0332 family)
MDPLDFFATANRLKISQQEADIRTAIGRAYYAVFNYIRSYLASNNITLKHNFAHRDLQTSIRNSGINEARELAQKIQELYDERRNADYEMGMTGWNTKDCNLLVFKAQMVIRSFQNHEGPDLISGVKSYLRNTLGRPI